MAISAEDFLNNDLKTTKIGGKDLYFQAPLSDAVLKADADMRAAGLKGLNISSSFRTKDQQEGAYNRYKSGQGGLAAKPGQSRHEKGLAVDISNWKEAEPFLKKYGLVNPFVGKGDPVHFQFPGIPGSYKPKTTPPKEVTPISKARGMVADSSDKATPPQSAEDFLKQYEGKSAEDFLKNFNNQPQDQAGQLPPPHPVEGPLPPGARPPEPVAKAQPNIDLTMGLNQPVQVRPANGLFNRAGEIANRTAEGAVKAGYSMANAPLQTLRQVVGGVLGGNKDQAIDALSDLGAGAIQGAARTAGALTGQNNDFARDPGGTMLNAGLVAKGAERPTAALSKASGAIREGVASGLKNASQKLYESAMKVPPSVSIEQRAKAVQTGIEERVPVTKGGLEKNRSAIDDLNKQIAEKIDGMTNEGGRISVKDAVKTVYELKDFYSNLPPDVAAKFTEPLDQLKQDYLSGGDTITAAQAQKMKQTIYVLHRKHYGDLKAAEVEGHKAVARGLKEQLVKENPELAVLNAKDSARIGLDEFLERAVNRSRNWNVISLGGAIMSVGGEVAGGPLGAAAGLMLRHMADAPWFKSRLSFALDRANKIIAKRSEALSDPIRSRTPVGKWENAEVPPRAQIALKESEIENSRLPRTQKDALIAELRAKKRPSGPSEAPSRSAQEARRVRTKEPVPTPHPKPEPLTPVSKSAKASAEVFEKEQALLQSPEGRKLLRKRLEEQEAIYGKEEPESKPRNVEPAPRKSAKDAQEAEKVRNKAKKSYNKRLKQRTSKQTPDSQD